MLNSVQIQTQLLKAQQLAQSGRMRDAWTVISPLRRAIDNQDGALSLYTVIAQSVGQNDAVVDALKRMLVIQHNPPAILGALADHLGNMGQHGDAYHYWTQLVAKDPKAIDAHLNRAIAATAANLLDEAVMAAEEGLKHAPAHARLLSAKGIALKNAGRIEDSLAAFEESVRADPSRSQTRYNQGVALRVACRYADAIAAYSEAERLGGNTAALYSSWAAAELEDGQVEAAIDHYQRALQLDPAHDESLRALTRIEFEYLGSEDPFHAYQESVSRRGGSVAAWSDWVNALIRNDRHAEAEEVSARALKAHPHDLGLKAMNLFLRGMTGDACAPLEELDRLAKQPISNSGIREMVGLLAIRAGAPERAVDHLQELVEMDPTNQVAWSQLSVVWRLLGDPREDWLCDYDRLVMTVDVPSPDRSMNPEEFARTVASALRPLHQTSFAPGDQTLRGGTQTSGNLFERPDPAIQLFKLAILQGAAAALEELPDDPTHPFLRRKSKQMAFSGSWSVLLRGGGHHVPHYHSEGWMSSAYYAEVPTSDDRSATSHEGWIQFGSPPEVYGQKLEPRRLVEPSPGKLVLFPSYLWHSTVPFNEGRGERLTAAFDYVPK